MRSLILELQRDALDRAVRPSDLLRKALIVAKKLRLEDMTTWIKSELSGYSEAAEIPDYRKIRGEVKALNPYRGWVPIKLTKSPRLATLFRERRRCGQGVPELESLIEQKGKDSAPCTPLPPDLERMIQKGIGENYSIAWFTQHQYLVRILDSVRTEILNWSLKLEEEDAPNEGLPAEQPGRADSSPSRAGGKTYRVFISYSWSNSAERRALQVELSTISGVEVLVDKDSIRPGDSIHDRIDQNILSADCVVALLTEEGLKSREVADELTRCHDRRKFIIPVVEKGTSLETIPWYLRDTNYIPYDARNFDSVVEIIVDAVKGRASPLIQFSDSPEHLKSLVNSSAVFLEVPSEEAVFSNSPMEDYRLCELRMQESRESFVFRVAARMCIGRAAEYLARRLLPHLDGNEYTWTFEYEGAELGVYQTFETAGVTTGAALYLVGTFQGPTRFSPKFGN